MFKRLRNRFIIMHMSVVTLIVMLFFGSVLLFANNRINHSIEVMLGENKAFVMGRGGPRRIDTPLSFTVTFTPSGGVVNVASPFEMSEDFYAKAVKQSLSKKSDIGRIKTEGVNLGYKVNGNSMSFIDISREVEMFDSLVWIFWRIAIPLLLFIFLASVYFARRSIRPIESAFIKQKEFVADASHELKTPLATISTNADVLLQEAPSKWATHIKAESIRMANLVESLLYLAKVDYAEKSEFEPVHLGQVLNEVLLPLEAIIHEKEIDLQVKSEDVTINGDKTQIHRLFGILIDNAIKYSDRNISIAVDKHAQITVANSGNPIPPEKLDKLFDRFYRVDESHQYTGSFGLGLSIAKAIVDRHKGEIMCKSDEINGTKFIVRL